jgi:hypothetical protein
MTWLKARMWAVLSALTAILAVLGAVYGKGRSDARKTRAADDDREYRDERQKVDAEISGIGGNDADNIKRLQSIAKRRGTGSD